MNEHLAVMDLGTNTFHLLIADGDLQEIVHEQEAVKLGEGGINKGLIQPAAYERGIKTMQHFAHVIRKNNVRKVKAIATSALRNASNGGAFINEVKLTTGINIEVIDGDAEAAYIYKGVKAGGCLSDQNSLVIDIGGGSVELIICNESALIWKQSVEIGAARLMDKFHQTDPIPPESINQLNQYLQEHLNNVFAAASNYTINNMIGSSGVFETYAGLIETRKGNAFDLKQTRHYEFDENDLIAVMESLIRSSHHERAGTKGIIPIRVDMIVTATLLTRFVMQKLGLTQVMMSTNSLKEGVLAEMVSA